MSHVCVGGNDNGDSSLFTSNVSVCQVCLTQAGYDAVYVHGLCLSPKQLHHLRVQHDGTATPSLDKTQTWISK